MSNLLGLSMTQPWASLVALGAKQYETRSWKVDYRGTVLIHAAKKFPSGAKLLCSEFPFNQFTPNPKDLPVGAIVAVAKIERMLRTEYCTKFSAQELAFGDYSPDRWAWELSGVIALPEPIPCNGALGLWPVSSELKEKVWSVING